LYRRYRPQRFAEVLGQDHAVLALRNAVATKKVGHAYLFSGPRGTGKTSIARILAKALNCPNVSADGEPDGTCDSCLQIQQGNSLDVHEMDAASNNGVDAMRDLVSRAALGTPGEWKVYIVDEVHMLSTAASNALLKTLEEPPAHVVFVLATTDPQKVLPTIRSRTQHFEFRLLSPELLSTLVHRINAEANLQVPEGALDLVVRRGRGSARDTLSVLDQVAAAGVVDDEHEILDEIIESLCERDTGRALVAVAEGVNNGREPQRIAVDLLEYLRNGFLALMARNLVPLPDAAIARVEDQARRLGAPALVRALEGIGAALLDMRDAPETRVTFEVALVRLTNPGFGTDPAALLERIERLEKGQVAPAGPARPVEARESAPAQDSPPRTAAPSRPPMGNQPPPPPRPNFDAPASPASPQAALAPTGGPRPSLGGLRRQQAANPPAAPAVQAVQPPAPTTSSAAPQPAPVVAAGEVPTVERLSEVWSGSILEALPNQERSRYRAGRFVAVTDGTAVFALPNAFHKDRCEEVRKEVELALSSHFGVRIPLQLTVEGEPATPGEPPSMVVAPDAGEEEEIDFSETTEGEKVEVLSPQERLLRAFPGAEEIPTT
jgi:DNA polymerase-3 subunit gamma/tau